MENKEDVKTLCGKDLPPILVDLRKIHIMSDDAREYFAMRNRNAGVKAIALVIKSRSSKLIGNIYLSINKPTVPTRLFTNEESAEKWLKENFISN